MLETSTDGALTLDEDTTIAQPGGERVYGAVLWFNEALGYGFVFYNEIEHFVHYSQIDMPGFKTLRPGQVVSFIPANGPRGEFCQTVQVVR